MSVSIRTDPAMLFLGERGGHSNELSLSAAPVKSLAGGVSYQGNPYHKRHMIRSGRNRAKREIDAFASMDGKSAD